MSNTAVAATIKQQIGMWPLAEVGARKFMHLDDCLAFLAKPRHRLVSVHVKLTPADTYTVSVWSKDGLKLMYEITDVYADSLATVIRNLPKVV